MVSELLVVPVLLVTLGSVGVYKGWKRRGVHAQMAEVDPTPIRELDAPGVVEVEGTATPSGEPLSGPVTGRDGVAAAWLVEEWDERGDTAQWREVARGIEVAPFEVTDDTGSVAVESHSARDTAGKWTQTTGHSASDGVRLDDAMLEFETFPQQSELDPDEDVPAALRALHEEHGLYEDTGSVTNAVDVGKKHGRRRYTEQVVEPGEDVYVLGRVEARDDPERERLRPEDAHLTTPDDGLFVLSDQDEASLEAEFAASARTLFLLGVVSTVVGVGVLVAMYGPV